MSNNRIQKLKKLARELKETLKENKEYTGEIKYITGKMIYQTSSISDFDIELLSIKILNNQNLSNCNKIIQIINNLLNIDHNDNNNFYINNLKYLKKLDYQQKRKLFKKFFDNFVNYNLYDYCCNIYKSKKKNYKKEINLLDNKLFKIKDNIKKSKNIKDKIEYENYYYLLKIKKIFLLKKVFYLDNLLDYILNLKNGIILDILQKEINKLLKKLEEKQLDFSGLVESIKKFKNILKLIEIEEAKNLILDIISNIEKYYIKPESEELIIFLKKYDNGTLKNYFYNNFDIINLEIKQFINEINLDKFATKKNGVIELNKEKILYNFYEYINKNDKNIELILNGNISIKNAINNKLEEYNSSIKLD